MVSARPTASFEAWQTVRTYVRRLENRLAYYWLEPAEVFELDGDDMEEAPEVLVETIEEVAKDIYRFIADPTLSFPTDADSWELENCIDEWNTFGGAYFPEVLYFSFLDEDK